MKRYTLELIILIVDYLNLWLREKMGFGGCLKEWIECGCFGVWVFDELKCFCLPRSIVACLCGCFDLLLCIIGYPPPPPFPAVPASLQLNNCLSRPSDIQISSTHICCFTSVWPFVRCCVEGKISRKCAHCFV